MLTLCPSHSERRAVACLSVRPPLPLQDNWLTLLCYTRSSADSPGVAAARTRSDWCQHPGGLALQGPAPF